jgi:hypothetical protein
MLYQSCEAVSKEAFAYRVVSLPSVSETAIVRRDALIWRLNDDLLRGAVFGEERRRYVGVHYRPFRGRVLSRELWNLEKKN